jgi:hypothetical protein
MAGLWARLHGRRSPPPDAARITGDVFSDAAIARVDLEPAARPPPPALSARYVGSSPEAAKARQQKRSDGEFESCLDADVLDLDALRALAWNGVPRRRRARVWRCLLKCEGGRRDERQAAATARRAAFNEAVAAALHDVPSSERTPEDAVMLRQILVDAPRTCPGSPLFAHDRVQALVVNVLYVWAVRHPLSGYVQGMNDLLAVFLLVLVDEVSDEADASAIPDDVLDDVAADAYACLNGVLESLDDHYVHRQPGLERTINEVDGLLRRVDADLHKHLDDVGVLLLQVTFRWINCLLVRELPMRCAIRLWDTCLAEERGFRTFFPYICTAFLCHFSETLKTKPTEDVHLFLTSLPTAHWSADEVETLLSEAYILSTLFGSAPAHLAHEPDGITPCGGFL